MESENTNEKDRHIVTLTVNELKLTVQQIVRKELARLNDLEGSDSLNQATNQILLTRMEVADIFKVSTVSLDKWKRAGILPKPIKMAGKVYYLKEEIIQMIKKRQKK